MPRAQTGFVAPGREAAMSLLDRCYAWRDRLLGNPAFQRFSASFPLTRPIADAQARALFDLCAGFVYSQVLFACVRLDLFARLADRPRTAAELSRDLSLSPDATERLLRAAVSLRLVARRSQDRYGLGMLGAALHGDPGIAAMIRHHAMLYADLADPVALLRGDGEATKLSTFWAYAPARGAADLGDAQVAQYSALMAASQSFIARDVLDAYPFDRHHSVLDVGGGEGAFALALAERFPALDLMLFDLPAVAQRARARIDASPQRGRIVAHGGSFVSGALPAGADLITLVRVAHDHDDAKVLTLLHKIRAALAPGGTIVIAEPMAGVRGAEPVGDAYFGMYLLAMGSGRARTPDELQSLLETAGFGGIRRWSTRRPMLVGVMSGTVAS